MMTVRTLPAGPGPSTPGRSRTGAVLATSAAALAALALYNVYRARRAEREHPPAGRFVKVDGVWLHYVERGQGQPLVLLHGIMTLIQDWGTSGVLDRAAEHYRVIAFDRPGYGYSGRTRDRVWPAAAPSPTSSTKPSSASGPSGRWSSATPSAPSSPSNSRCATPP